MDDLVKRLREPLTAGMFLNLSALVAELEKQRQLSADRIEADAKRIAELENRLGAIATSHMNDLVLMGMARDAAEARVKVLEARIAELEAKLPLGLRAALAGVRT